MKATKHPLYRTWSGMKARCNDKNNKNYGGRGITVCERWASTNGFTNFIADMGEKPDGTSLERIDNEKGYYPGNCKWATPAQQARNTRNTRGLRIDGKDICKKDLAEYMGVSRPHLDKLLRSGENIFGTDRTETISILGASGTYRDVADRLGLWHGFFYNKKDWKIEDLENYTRIVVLLREKLPHGFYTYNDLMTESMVHVDSHALIRGMSKNNSPRLREVYEDMRVSRLHKKLHRV